MATTIDLKTLARLGASTRLEQLAAERAAIFAQFPELRGEQRRRAHGAVTGRRRRRRKMSAAARAAISAAQKKRWAAQRAAKGK